MMESILPRMKSSLQQSGIDIVQPLALCWYNTAMQHAPASRIKSKGNPHAAILLIGNSKSIWKPFLNAHQSLLRHKTNPLDEYINSAVMKAIQICEGDISNYRIFWGNRPSYDLGDENDHSPSSTPAFVGMQRMASAAGLAYLDETSHLSIHPRFGPWYSLRAAIVFDDITFGDSQPSPLECPFDIEAVTRIEGAMKVALQQQRAGAPSLSDIHCSYERWVSVRDAPFPNHPERYSQDQIAYHYTGDRTILGRNDDHLSVS